MHDMSLKFHRNLTDDLSRLSPSLVIGRRQNHTKSHMEKARLGSREQRMHLFLCVFFFHCVFVSVFKKFQVSATVFIAF